MQHLLLAISIILLTVIAGNERRLQNKSNKISTIIETEKAREEEEAPAKEVDTDFSIRLFVIDKYGI
jgi:hypothetical protein